MKKVVQLNEKTSNPDFTGCFMIVDEFKSWGVQGYIQIPGQGVAYYRAENGTYDIIGDTSFYLSE